MKKNNNIDELFKSKLEDREFDIKPAFLDDLNDQLDAHGSVKRRKKFFYFFAVTAFVLLLVFLGTVVVSNDDSVQQAKQESNVSSSSTVDGKSNTISNTGTSESNQNSSIDSSENNEANSEEEYGNRQIITHLGREDRNIEKEGGEANDSKGDDGKPTKAEKEAEKQKLAQQEASRKAKEAKETERLKAELAAKKKAEEEAKQIAKEKAAQEAKLIAERKAKEKEKARAEEANNATKKDSTSTNNANNETANNGTATDTTGAASNPELALETGGENPDVVDETDSTNSDTPDATEPDVKVDLSNNGTKVSPWSLQVSVGGSFVTKNAIAGSTESIAIRKAQEENIYTPQFNFGVNYNLNKLILSTGLGYIQYGENLKYTQVTKDTTFISSYTVVVDTMTSDTTLVPNYTTTSDTNTVAMDANTNNRHSYITIPLNFGYQFNIGNKFSITPKGGVDLRLLVGGSGKYISNELTGILEERDDVITIGFNGSIEFAYSFDKLSLFVAPTYNSTFKSFKSLHKYNGIGGMFGVIYKF